MESSTFFFSLSLITLSLILIKLITSPNKKYLPLPPSPPSLPVVSHLHLFKKPLHRALSRLSLLYGPDVLLLRFGSRPVLIVSSQSAAEECFNRNDIAFANRPRLPSGKPFSYNYTTLSFLSYGPHLKIVRRIATIELLSSGRLQSLLYVRREEVDSLVSDLFMEYCAKEEVTSLRHVSRSNEGTMVKLKKIELRPRLFNLTFKVMMRMIVGKRGDGETAARFQEVVEEGMELIGTSNVSDFMWVLRAVDFGGVKKRMRRHVEKREVILQGFIDEMRKDLEEDRKEDDKKKCMLEVLLGLQKEEPGYYTDVIIKAMIVSLFFAGTDTSTNTMEWAMSLLLNNPNSLKKARDEIDSLVEEPRLLQEDDLSNLPYLQAIINETFRLCPAAPLLVPHESREECMVGGYRVPSGTILLVNAWAIHRDSKTWENPEQFKPERFLDDDCRAGDGACRIMPFGMGRRKCPGDGLATRLVGLALGRLIQSFEWERAGDELVDMKEGGGITLHMVNPLQAMYRPRQSMIDVLSRISTI